MSFKKISALPSEAHCVSSVNFVLSAFSRKSFLQEYKQIAIISIQL